MRAAMPGFAERGAMVPFVVLLGMIAILFGVGAIAFGIPNNAFGFGGHNAVLVIRAFGE